MINTKMPLNKKIILFDLDGVIINSLQNMEIAWNFVSKKNQLNIPFKEYRKYIGLPFNLILKKLKIKKNYHLLKKNYDSYSIKKVSKIKLYPKVKNVLNHLNKDYILGVITSKDKYRTKKIIDRFNLSFKYVYSPSKKIRSKPYPDQIIKILKKEKIDKKNCYYVGDMRIDSLFAKNARINFIFAKYGYEKKKIKCKNKIKNFESLKKIF